MNDQLEIRIQKNNPKPNAEKYEIKTIEDFMNVATEENMERLLKDFCSMVRIGVHYRNAVYAMVENKINENTDGIIDFNTFTWIDD